MLTTSELFPDPETPVNTVKRRFGISTQTSLRLFSRAPVTRIESMPAATATRTTLTPGAPRPQPTFHNILLVRGAGEFRARERPSPQLFYTARVLRNGSLVSRAKTLQPNILLVMADQLAPHFTGAYDHPLVRTPAMDSLVERGTRFDAAYCPFPLCAPSRYSMLTGQPATAIGAWDNASELPSSIPTLAHYLRVAGYRTTLSGKMHFVGPDQLHGFNERLTTDVYPADFAWTPDWDAPAERMDKWWHNMTSLSEAGQAMATYQMDYDEEVGFAAVRHLYDLARDTDQRPFFLTVSFIHPHDPYMARPEWWNLYDSDDIDLPDVPPLESLDPHTVRIRHGIEAETVGYTEAQVRNARHAFYANTSYVDSWLGTLVRVLEETGRLDDTVVIFTSDHGDMLGDRGAWFKMSFFERSARVPLIMAGPDISNGAVPNACSLLDMVPTLLDIAGDRGRQPEPSVPGRPVAASGRAPRAATTPLTRPPASTPQRWPPTRCS